MAKEFRIGQGFDVHAFSDDRSRALVLGGVTFADLAQRAGGPWVDPSLIAPVPNPATAG